MKDRLTISIVWHDHRKPVVISVKKNFVKGALLIILFFLISWLFLQWWGLQNFMDRKKLAHEKELLLKKQQHMERERARLEKAEAQIDLLQKKISEIEKYLADRGVRLENKNSVGGRAYKQQLHPSEDFYNFLFERAEKLSYLVRTVPAGYPVNGKITSTYGWRKNPFGKGYEFHTGIDIEAPYGALVKATADGVVVFTGFLQDYGKTVIIRHESGYETLYAHLSTILVKEGTRISAGQAIGRVGSTGRSTGPHLHYEVISASKPINPDKFMSWR